jgi:hypothetical protein
VKYRNPFSPDLRIPRSLEAEFEKRVDPELEDMRWDEPGEKEPFPVADIIAYCFLLCIVVVGFWFIALGGPL